MVVYGQLVCAGCNKVLSYPLGALSCRCRNCSTVNPAQSISIPCQGCKTEVMFPINTLQGLCPCCCTVINIPLEMLPPVPEINSAGPDGEGPTVTVYVENPAPPSAGGKVVPSMGVANKIM